MCLHNSCWSLHYPFKNRVSTYLVPRVEACTFTIPFRIVCIHTSCWGDHLQYPLQNRVSTYIVLRRAPSLPPSQSCVYIYRVEASTFSIPFGIVCLHSSCWGTLSTPFRIVCLHTSCWSLHLHYPLQNRVSTYLMLRRAHSLSPSQSCVYISRVEVCTINVPFTIVCLHTSCWGEHIIYPPPPYNRASTYLVLKHAPSMCPSQSCVYIPRVGASTFSTPFTIVCLHISCWSMHLQCALHSRVSTYLVLRRAYSLPFTIVCLHTSCWRLHLHYPLQDRMSTYIVLRRAHSLSPSQSFVYIPRVVACTFTIPFRIVCLHTSCWSLHLHYPLQNRVSTYLVLRRAPSISP